MNILCAIDGSRNSRWALEMLQHLCFPSDSRLLLVHVLEIARFRPRRTFEEPAREAMRQALELAERSGRDLLQRARAMISPGWGTVEHRLLRGHPADAMTRIAARRKTELIVIGSRGLTDFRPFLLGSISRKLVMHAPCSVLVVKRRTRALSRIVVGADGSKYSQRAVQFLLRLPLPKEARMTVVSVVPPLPIEAGPNSGLMPSILEQVRGPLEKEARKVAMRVVEHIHDNGFETTAEIAHGHVGHEIVKLAESVRAELVVVGSRGLTGTTRYLMGSVSDNVVKYAPCPVLVVR